MVIMLKLLIPVVVLLFGITFSALAQEGTALKKTEVKKVVKKKTTTTKKKAINKRVSKV